MHPVRPIAATPGAAAHSVRGAGAGHRRIPRRGEAPEALARRLARAKAETVVSASPGSIVIGSDQVATLDGRTPVGKPGTHEAARRQLAAASGQAMHFYTAFALLAPGYPAIEGACRWQSSSAASRMRDRSLSRARAALRLRRRRQMRRLGIALLKGIRTDDPTALIGLPLMQVADALRQVGLPPT